MNYVIITPAKNESKFIRRTLDSLVAQTKKPSAWVIVDDMSTDNTVSVIEEYTDKFDWIILKRLTDAQKRKHGANVVNVFQQGYEAVKNTEWDFIVKLDADLTLPDNYFEEICKEFKKNQKVGLCGGRVYDVLKDDLKLVSSAKYHLYGSIKAYRKKCFEDIGGLIPCTSWDSVDEIKAMYLGWETLVREDLKVLHHRPTGISIGQLNACRGEGVSLYEKNVGVFIMVLRSMMIAVKRKPFVITGFAVILGYFQSMINGHQKVLDKDTAKFYRKLQYQRIRKLNLR